MQVHSYQEIASRQLLERTKLTIDTDEIQKDVYLKAITGAGKTVLMADYMAKTYDFYEGMKDVAFVWMSIGTGGLHEQSYQALIEVLPNHINVLNNTDFKSKDYLEHKDLLVLNWETVNRMDINDGVVTYNNASMRDGEQISLPKLFKQTRDYGTKIVMIIDEAHVGAGQPSNKDRQRSQIIKDEISPNLIINVTATPKFGTGVSEDDVYKVDTKYVVKEGRIKKQVLIDDQMDSAEEDYQFIERVIRSAVIKQKHLSDLYDETGNQHINPLCLIQIPNGAEGTLVKASVEKILDTLGFNYDKGNLAEAVDDNTNMENVKNLSSPVCFLINKQAISTGWDAPRAQIWVKLRDTQSTVFDAQTLGRILRMPEGIKIDDPSHPNYKFFEADELNYAYVYTDANYSVKTDEYKAIYPTEKQLKDIVKTEVVELKLKREWLDRSDQLITGERIKRAASEMIARHYQTSKRDLTQLRITIGHGRYETHALEDVETVIDTKTFILSNKEDIIRYTKDFLSRACGGALSYKTVFKSIRIALNDIYGEDFTSVRKWILLNKEIVDNMIKGLKVEAANVRNVTAEEKEDSFVFPDSVLISDKRSDDVYEKCAYTNQVKKNLGTESAFEDIIEERANVKWWIKNADSGKEALSILYTDENNKKREFYPDYVVRFTDETIGIYETKSEPDLKPDNTLVKERALTHYLNKLRREQPTTTFKGGIIYLKKIGDTYRIHGNNYPEFTTESN